MNANMLRAKIKENGLTQKDVSERIGMSENSLSRKICGKRDFSLSEIMTLCAVLSIERPQDIFFQLTSQICNKQEKCNSQNPRSSGPAARRIRRGRG